MYPSLDRIKEISQKVAIDVVKYLFDAELATYRPEPHDHAEWVTRHVSRDLIKLSFERNDRFRSGSQSTSPSSVTCITSVSNNNSSNTNSHRSSVKNNQPPTNAFKSAIYVSTSSSTIESCVQVKILCSNKYRIKTVQITKPDASGVVV